MSSTEHRLFEGADGIKPVRYPELAEYKDAIRKSYWVDDEFTFSGDVQDFRANTTEVERSIIKKTLLAISQVEVKVKSFWGDIDKTLPHSEIGDVGRTFSESEVRHKDAYSRLLDKLGLQDAFESLSEVDAIQSRIEYLDECLSGADSSSKREYVRSILLFSTFVEHVSLFSQFLIMMSFDKYEKKFKGIANVVSATSKEEQIHGLFGQEIVRTIRKEYPHLFDSQFEREIQDACHDAYVAEMEILDWIFSEGSLSFLSRECIDAFVADRLNEGLEAVNISPVFEVDEDVLEETRWFRVELNTTRDNDFFAKGGTAYTKHSQDVSPDQMF